ncbi:8523_t:CDS:2 [Scutellospora calospora]|uniref:8523_t:CDS:1 n=1 Tax=Scutellospora calospora TaxID=85575 RepID=A0ACA9JUI9_9GLOM|nr:8523_t:CDS:2 [Scutellospora calospora]
MDESESDIELEVLIEYDSAEDFSEIDSFDDNEVISDLSDKNCFEVTTLNNEHVGYKLHPLAKQFNLMLRKLLKEILEEIYLYNAISRFRHDFEPVRDDMRVLLKRLYEKKIEDPHWVFSMEIDPKQVILQIGPQNVVNTIFEPVARQLNKFMMPNIIKKQEEQMNLSLHYHAIEINFEVILFKEKEIDKLDQYIDNLFDCSQVQLSLFTTDSSIILELDVNRTEEFTNKVVLEQSSNEIFKAISKKHHPKKSDSKRIKSVIENFNTKTQYKYKVYKQEGHNSKICKEKSLWILMRMIKPKVNVSQATS